MRGGTTWADVTAEKSTVERHRWRCRIGSQRASRRRDRLEAARRRQRRSGRSPALMIFLEANPANTRCGPAQLGHQHPDWPRSTPHEMRMFQTAHSCLFVDGPSTCRLGSGITRVSHASTRGITERLWGDRMRVGGGSSAGQAAFVSAAPTWSASRTATLSCSTDGRATRVAAVSTN